jgi:hypothetical protein
LENKRRSYNLEKRSKQILGGIKISININIYIYIIHTQILIYTFNSKVKFIVKIRIWIQIIMNKKIIIQKQKKKGGDITWATAILIGPPFLLPPRGPHCTSRKPTSVPTNPSRHHARLLPPALDVSLFDWAHFPSQSACRAPFSPRKTRAWLVDPGIRIRLLRVTSCADLANAAQEPRRVRRISNRIPVARPSLLPHVRCPLKYGAARQP